MASTSTAIDTCDGSWRRGRVAGAAFRSTKTRWSDGARLIWLDRTRHVIFGGWQPSGSLLAATASVLSRLSPSGCNPGSGAGADLPSIPFPLIDLRSAHRQLGRTPAIARPFPPQLPLASTRGTCALGANFVQSKSRDMSVTRLKLCPRLIVSASPAAVGFSRTGVHNGLARRPRCGTFGRALRLRRKNRTSKATAVDESDA